MKKVVFVLIFVQFLFFGCNEVKSSKLDYSRNDGQNESDADEVSDSELNDVSVSLDDADVLSDFDGDSDREGNSGDEDFTVSGYSCKTIRRCVKQRGSDEEGIEDCLNRGSTEGKEQYSQLIDCIKNNCSFLSNSKMVECAIKYCEKELLVCGFEEVEEGDFDEFESDFNSGDGAADSDAAENEKPDGDSNHEKPDGDEEPPSEEEGAICGVSGKPPCCGTGREAPCVDEISGYAWSDLSKMGMNWNEAKGYCLDLEEGDYPKGSWRLPTISELRTLVRECAETATDGSCGVTDDCLASNCCKEELCKTPCSYDWSGERSLFGEIYRLWSSSNYSDDANFAWMVDFGVASLSPSPKTKEKYPVRCVAR